MLIIRPHIFNSYPEIICGFSTKLGLNRNAPYFLNMSYNVGNERNIVDVNRLGFFKCLELDYRKLCCQKQVHGDKITIVNEPGDCGESDAIITDRKNLVLAITSADCPAIFIYDQQKKIIAAVHSGWRSTAKKILEKTIFKLKENFGIKAENLICYIAPSISQRNYEVKKDVAEYFHSQFIRIENDRYFLNLSNTNYKMLIKCGIKESNVQVSKLCTFEHSHLLHSYRRDGGKSGRAIGIIVIKGDN